MYSSSPSPRINLRFQVNRRTSLDATSDNNWDADGASDDEGTLHNTYIHIVIPCTYVHVCMLKRIHTTMLLNFLLDDTYIDAYIHIHIHKYIHTSYIQTCIVPTYIHYINTYKHTNKHTYITLHKYIHTYIHYITYIHFIHYIHTYIDC